MIIKNAAGATVLTLGDDDFVGGYLVKDFDDSKRTHRRETSYASRVSSEWDVTYSLNRVWLTLIVEVQGSSVGDLRAKKDALLAAVEVGQWILDVGSGIQWSCMAADSESPRRREAPGALFREVTLRIPAHPSTSY